MVTTLILLAADDGIFDIANGLVDSTESLLRAAAVVVAIGLVLVTYAKTRAWVPTLGAIVLAGIVLWGVNNTAFLRDTTEETIDSSAVAPARPVG